MSKIAGGCLCGSVRYTSEAEPALVAVCHCATCQKYTGSAFSLNVGVPSDSVTITGESLATYEDRSGQAASRFIEPSARSAAHPSRGAALPIQA